MRKKVLLIDDISEFLTMVKLVFAGSYDVFTALDGEEAMDMIRNGLKPDVIVTDLVMPRMDGYQLISKIQLEKDFRKIPIIVLSNVDKSEQEARLKRKGVRNYLNKPFTVKELKEGLGQSLSKALTYN